MPRSTVIQRDEILSAALDLVRREGFDALSARNLARAMSVSTQPIFSHFSCMQELQRAVLEAGFALYASFLQEDIASGRYPAYKATGMAYIRFARQEKELFRLLFMTPQKASSASDDSWEGVVTILQEKTGMSHEEAVQFHAQMWIFVHGIAAMIATSFRDWEDETVSQMLSDQYFGLLARFGGEVHVRDRNA